MRGRFFVFVALTASVSGGLWACGNGDDTTVPPSKPVDAGPDGTTEGGPGDAQARMDAAETAAEADTGAGADGDAGSGPADAGALPPRLLLSFNGTGTQSELSVFGVDSKKVEGDLLYDGFIGTTYIGPKAPWLLEQANDVVARLDPAQPWEISARFNVALNDTKDGGAPYSDPDAVVVGAADKAYVLRYTRNAIAVIDPRADGGSTVGSIDLSGEVQPGDEDGFVEMSAGVYVPSRHLVYVLLGNVDKNDVALDGFTSLCASTVPTVVAVDTTSDTLVDLNGAAPGNGLALQGYGPIFGQGAMAYDAVNDRLLVLESGCNTPVTTPVTTDAGDGGDAGGDAGTVVTPGPLVKRQVEALSLFTGQSSVLVDFSATGEFPNQLVYVNEHRALLQLSSTYTWDPTSTTLGAAVPNAPDDWAFDGNDSLLGVSATYGTDGGFSGYAVTSVRIADGEVTQLGTNPFMLKSGFFGGVQLWPAP
ncbi:MAG TPA: hypothetical protein VHV30_09095 [Polyangiaceae bacterium]|jgi:hypothetical protein|nr:hypothetical protein [Polyangiaceae bacterium]